MAPLKRIFRIRKRLAEWFLTCVVLDVRLIKTVWLKAGMEIMK